MPRGHVWDALRSDKKIFTQLSRVCCNTATRGEYAIDYIVVERVVARSRLGIVDRFLYYKARNRALIVDTLRAIAR